MEENVKTAEERTAKKRAKRIKKKQKKRRKPTQQQESSSSAGDLISDREDNIACPGIALLPPWKCTRFIVLLISTHRNFVTV